ncbi:mitogen-activated protein kinase kinase kinase 18-like [Camellia sinensis]|uniref:mitogen-activated protein kinase kinase kinase 18-like n=1 Tax=Camellia sinensis TaxID=4442 RepID=UPI001036A1CC|nr:mitogen-activated protein kinase kinase kinase 18-like [Camellia sinensis]
MVFMKRKHEELEIKKSAYGDGNRWFRGSIIGKSSSGPVYLATLKKPKWRLTHLPVLMAVKSAEVSDSALLQRESLVLRNFHACPYIYRCFGEEVFTSDRNQMVYNLLLEYGSGGTLADVIKKTGGNGLPESDVRRYTRYILEGLDCVHSAGYVHRALKPENIIIVPIITSTGTEYIAKIGDLGLAKKSKQARKILTMPYKLRGSLQYSSPETMVDKGLQQEPPSDVWALGLIVFEMLTGKSVWDGKQDSEVEDILSEIGKGHGVLKLPGKTEVSEEAMDFLKGCLAGKAMDRLTAHMLLDLPFVAGLDYAADDELSSYAFPDYWNYRVIKKPKVDGEAVRVCSSLSYDAVDDAGLSSSFFSDHWSNMPLEAEELEEIAEPGSVYLTLINDIAILNSPGKFNTKDMSHQWNFHP